MRSRAPVCAALLAASLSYGTAQASPLFELAGGVTGTAGLNARAAGPGSPSSYFNPALLTQAAQGFELGVLVLSDQISMTLDGREGGNVPLVLGSFDAYVDGNPISKNTIPTRWLERGCPEPTCSPPFQARPRQAAGSSGVTRAYQIIGLVSELIADRFVLGLHALVPYGEFTTAHAFYNDEREQFFTNSLHPELYADRLTATSLAFGAALKPIDQLSVGVSFTLSLRNTAQASTYVPNSTDYDQLLVSTDVGVNAALSPHFGVTWSPSDSTHVSAVVHTVQKLEIDMQITAILPGGNESGTTRRMVHDYVPAIYTLGIAQDVMRMGPHRLGLAATADYSIWSSYLDRHGESPSRGGDDFAWSDTLSGSLGLRYGHRGLRSFLDVAYKPTPVPPQTGRTNYVDNDRLSTALGADIEVELLGLTFRPGAQLQAHRLLPRYQKKDDALIRDELPDAALTLDGDPVVGREGLQTNNPGWPGFASEGWIFGASASVMLLL
jgi:long-chain fatty acid transport protein